MIVGGALRGLTRSFRISLLYLRSYFLLGVPLILLVRGFLGGYPYGLGEAIQVVFYYAFACALAVLPTAVVANLAFARLFRGRTWRNETWRPWAAGILGIVFTWAGMVVLVVVQGQPPRFIRELLGGMADFINILGWFVLLSNLGLFLAWLIPSRRPLRRAGKVRS